MSWAIIHRIRVWRDSARRGLVSRLYDRKKENIQKVDNIRRIVFVRWDAKWGDSVVFSFVPRELHRDPEISVEAITTADMAPMFRDIFGVDKVYEARKRAGYGEIRRLARRIGQVDLLVFFSHQANHRAIYLLSQIQAKHIASLDDTIGLVDLKLGELTQGQHFAEKYVTLLNKCGVNEVDVSYIVPRDAQSEARVAEFLPGHRPFVCVNAYSKGSARSLNSATTERLIELLLVNLPLHDVCVLSAPGKQQEVERICHRVGAGRLFCLPDTCSIFDNIALISRADAMISGITSTVHIADGLGIPSFVLFPYDPIDRDDWHSRHPASINFLAEPVILSMSIV